MSNKHVVRKLLDVDPDYAGWDGREVAPGVWSLIDPGGTLHNRVRCETDEQLDRYIAACDNQQIDAIVDQTGTSKALLLEHWPRIVTALMKGGK